MTRPEVLHVLTDVLNKPAGSLKGSEKLKDLPGWDSMAVATFMGMYVDKFGVVLEPDDISNCITVDDLAALGDRPA
jgi:acyl carrier protein